MSGPLGCGKSTAAAALAKVAQSTPDRPVACHFCRAGDEQSLDPLEMVKSLAFQLACRQSQPERQRQRDDAATVPHFLQRVSGEACCQAQHVGCC